jgi:hypothetical protein
VRQKSERKTVAARKNLELAMAANRQRFTPTFIVCKHCGAQTQCKPREKRLGLKSYCSKSCMALDYRERMKGKANPNYRHGSLHTCETCGCQYMRRNSKARYCSIECRDRGEAMYFRPCRLDKNQGEIIEALEAVGATVLDASGVGFGVPDLIVGHMGVNHLMEVKNPANRYGRKGLTKKQQKWADGWNGAPVAIVRSPEDALAALGVRKKT